MNNEQDNIQSKDPSQKWEQAPEASVVLPISHHEPDLTSEPMSKAIIKLAGPAMISMMLLMIFTLVDGWWVGKLGGEQFAGVSAAAFFVWAIQSIGTLVSTGVTAMVARFVGARKLEKASLVTGQGMSFSILLSIICSVCAFLLLKPIFNYMGLDGLVWQAAYDYMFYYLIGLTPIFVFYVIEASFRGTGDTKTPLKIITVSLVINALLDPVLIFGYGPFPRLEAGGAALATVISHLLSVIVGIVLLQKRTVKITFAKRFSFINANLYWRITRIGAPIAFSGFMFSASYMFLTRVITLFGPGPLAALGLGHRIEGLAYFAGYGFAVAAETLVGQNLGAKKPQRAERAAWTTILYSTVLLGIISLCYYFFAEQIFGFFIKDTSVINEGVTYLKIIAFFEIFLGFELIFEGSFSGAGNSVPPMLVVVPVTWARIPLAILLADNFGLGSQGIWWSIAITTALKGIILAFWFRLGRWKTTRV